MSEGKIMENITFGHPEKHHEANLAEGNIIENENVSVNEPEDGSHEQHHHHHGIEEKEEEHNEK